MRSRNPIGLFCGNWMNIKGLQRLSMRGYCSSGLFQNIETYRVRGANRWKHGNLRMDYNIMHRGTVAIAAGFVCVFL